MVLVKAFGRNRSGKRGGAPYSPQLGTVADLAAFAGNVLATLTWGSVSGAVSFQVQYKLTSEPTIWTDFGSPVAAPATGASVTGLTNSSGYDFRVIASNGADTTTSNTASATPTTPGVGMVVVTSLAVDSVDSDTAITVSWTMGEDGIGAAAKYVLRWLSPTIDSDSWGQAYPTNNVYITTGLATSGTKTYQVTGLSVATAYQFMLKPYRGTEEVDAVYGAFSNIVGDTTTGTPAALGTPVLNSVNPGDAQATMNWTFAVNAVSHQPQYKLNSEPTTWTNFGAALGATAAQVTVTGLTNGSLYNFRVQASD